MDETNTKIGRIMELLQLIEPLAWPIAVVVLGVLFKRPLSELIKNIKNIKFIKNKEGIQVNTSFLATGLEDAKQNLEIQNTDKLPNQQKLSDPKLAILEAHKSLEILAEKKLKELNANLEQEEFKGTALSYLDYKGSFSPKIESVIRDIQFLRNQVAHSNSGDIDEEDAKDYLKVVQKIEKIIDALDTLPAMNLNAITMIMRNISVILDSNKYTDISIADIHRHIEDGTVLDFIANLDEAHELKGIMASELWKGFDKFYVQSLQSIYFAYAGDERRRWGIENSGICLLLAWTNEIIQMGSGWHANTDLSELDRE